MSVHDDDILDFDFVEAATQEAPARGDSGGGRPPGPSPKRPRQTPRPPHGLTPLLRLLGLIGVAIALVVLLAVWAEGCSSDGKRTAYNDYMAEIGDVGRESVKIGADLSSLLTTPGLKQAQLEDQLAGLVQRQQLAVSKAQGLNPPGPLNPPHDHAIEALELRAGGLQGMLVTFKAVASTQDSTVAGEQLAAQGRRLDAGDVVWEDFFRAAAEQVVIDEGVTGVTTPPSQFVPTPEVYSARQMTLVHQRIHGATTGGTTTGIHGSGIEGTKVLPAGTPLTTGVETIVRASIDLEFEVSVKNTGDNQEVQLQVTLTIPAEPSTIVKKGVIGVIDPGEVKTVIFKDFPEVPFGDKTTVQVSVKPVAGEANTQNNSREYPVVFSFEN